MRSPRAVVTLDLDACLAGRRDLIDSDCLLRKLRALPPGALPLAGACVQGGIVDDSDLSFSLLASNVDHARVQTRVGVFFVEVVGGCNCHDDPARTTSYAILQVDVARRNGLATITLASGSDAYVD